MTDLYLSGDTGYTTVAALARRYPVILPSGPAVLQLQVKRWRQLVLRAHGRENVHRLPPTNNNCHSRHLANRIL
jgi:hypothetical protein